MNKIKRERVFVGRQKTHEEYVKEIYELVVDEYTVLGKYTKAKGRIDIKHNLCGTVNNVIADSFLRGRRCSTCSGNKKISQVEFEKKIDKEGNGEYIVLGKYVNSDTKLELFHKICKKVYTVVPYHFFSGSRCSHCSGYNISHEVFVETVRELVGDDYSILGEYKNAYTAVMLKHNLCGSEFPVRPSSFVSNGTRCPNCYAVNKLKNTEIFKEEVFILEGNKYTVLGEYKFARKKLQIRHEKCGNEYPVTPNNFLRGNRCPFCISSKGEQRIKKWLDVKKIEYITQYRFEDCRGMSGYKLPFDFAIYIKENLICLIEFDGRQHYEAIDYFGGEEGLRETQVRDKIKTAYCEKRAIPLIRIPFYEVDKIEAILEAYLLRKMKL